MEKIPNIRNIDLRYLSKGDIVRCKIEGTQGFDGSKFDFKCLGGYFILTKK